MNASSPAPVGFLPQTKSMQVRLNWQLWTDSVCPCDGPPVHHSRVSGVGSTPPLVQWLPLTRKRGKNALMTDRDGEQGGRWWWWWGWQGGRREGEGLVKPIRRMKQPAKKPQQLHLAERLRSASRFLSLNVNAQGFGFFFFSFLFLVFFFSSPPSANGISFNLTAAAVFFSPLFFFKHLLSSQRIYKDMKICLKNK